MNARLFPVIIIVLSLGAAVVYALIGDWRRCIYFTAAAVLNITVVF